MATNEKHALKMNLPQFFIPFFNPPLNQGCKDIHFVLKTTTENISEGSLNNQKFFLVIFYMNNPF